MVDDHAFMRLAIHAILTRDSSLEVVGEAKDGQEAIERCQDLRPDLVLMEAVKAGAAGYVLKGKHPDHVLDAVRAVLDEETPLEQGLAMKLLRTIGEEATAQENVRPQTQPITSAEPAASAASMLNPLTPRETEVLSHLASGKTNRQIAQRLHLSLSAAVKAVELGLRPPGWGG